MNRIQISITCFDDVKEACRAVISIFNSYPSHLLMLQDRPEKKRSDGNGVVRAPYGLERLLGCDMNGSVVWHAEDAMISVKVFVQRELENRRAAMSGNDNRPSKEEGPNAEPALAILGNYLFAVRKPVVIPVEDRGRIVDAEDVYILHFKASCLEVAYHPA
jgi:hypothetical protein